MAPGANVTMLAQRRVADFWRRLSLRLRVADFAGNVALGDELVSASGIVQPVGVFDFIGVSAGGYVKDVYKRQPLSKAVLATMVLFYAVGFWNQWLQPLIYLDDRKKFPMQLILRNIVLGADAALSKSMSAATDMATMGLNIKYAVIFVTILPILVIYPFVQKYFVKGVMVGSVKG